MKDIR